MLLEQISFKQIEAWCLLFGLEESYGGVARTAYDAWFNLLRDSLWALNMPVLDKLRILVAARVPLFEPFSYRTTVQIRAEFERVLHLPPAGLYHEESFHLACDCLRLSHETRDLLKAGQEV